MSVKAMSWVWSHSRSKPTQRLVLLAIADCANDQGREAYPSTATLASKTGLSERAVRRTVTELSELGELAVQYKTGPRGTNRYRVIMRDYPATESGSDDTRPEQPGTRPQSPGTRTDSPPATESGYPDGQAGYPARESADPATLAPEPSLTVRREAAASPPPGAGQSMTQRSKRITDAYAMAEPMCKWPAVNGVVLKAIKSERFTDAEIESAVLRLAGEGRSVTVETLRIELAGMPPSSNGRRSSAAAAKTIPAAEQCPEHRGYPGGNRDDGQARCGQCRAGTAGGRRR